MGGEAKGYSLGELAEKVAGQLEGPESDVRIEGIGSLEEATGNQITVLDTRRYLKYVPDTAAAAILTDREFEVERNLPVIRVEDPKAAVRTLLNLYAPEPWLPEPGIDQTAIIDETAVIGRNVTIGAHCVIGPHAEIGDRCVLYFGCVVGAESRLGADSVMRSNAVVRERCTIGDRATLYSGSVIGSDGYGFDVYKDGPVPEIHRIPQIGTVEIGSDFELGASSTVDRAKFGVTRIGNHVKIDNVCHVGHNCRIGHFCGLVAGTMLAGSANVGNGVMFWGQAGAVGHILVADGTEVFAQTAVTKPTQPGQKVIGFPGTDYNKWARSQAEISRLPKLKERVAELEARLAALEKRDTGSASE